MTELDNKINTHFPGLVVRKDLVKTVKGNAIVPSYVLEYLLGQYCASNDEPTISTGIETVKEILRKHYVHRNEAGLVRSNIKEKGRYLDIFQHYEMNDAFAFSNRLQQFRPCKAFEITYLRDKTKSQNQDG
jgi:predicted ATP-dependent Lon-type protease